MVSIHIYGARFSLILFCDNQDTESESCEIEMSNYQPIFTHEKTSKVLSDKNNHTLQDVETIVVILHVYGALVVFLIFLDNEETESKSCEKEI